MEDNLIVLRLEDNLISFKWRTTWIFFLQMEDDQNKFISDINFNIQMADDLNIIVNGRQPLKLKKQTCNQNKQKLILGLFAPGSV